MTPEELNHIAQQWFTAFNEHNVEKILALYNDEAVHYSPKLKVRQPETQGLIKGKNTMRAWWKDSFDRLPTLQYEIVRLTPHEDRVFMEYIRHVQGEEDLFVGEMLEVSDGLIIKSRVFHT